MIAGFAGLSMPSYASPPMPVETIETIKAALPQCTGGWIESGKRGRVFPVDLAPRLALLSRPSVQMDQDAGQDLYQIAKGLLAPAIGTHERMMDGDASLKCPAHPKEAVALMEYLIGATPDERRGASNALDWLGLAYKTGASGVKDPAEARRYYLRFRMHVGVSPEAQWSDGIDNSLLGNVERAGLRPYLEALAESSKGGGAARIALAEAALPTNPVAARQLLRYLDDRPLNRLLELEDLNRIPVAADDQEVAFWAEATRTLFGYRKYAARMMKAVKDVNGGDIPTSPSRPSIDLLRAHLDMAAAADADATRDPIPVRALVNPQGHPIYVEACSARPAQPMPLRNFNVQLDVARLYNVRNVDKLPKLPIVKFNGLPAYGWVILPAVHFRRVEGNSLKVDFADLPQEQCVYSAVAQAPFLTIAR